MGKKESKKKDNLTLIQTLKNDWFALKLGASYSKSFVTGAFFRRLFGYFEWVYWDGIFLRVVVGALDEHKSFESILWFILISTMVLIFTNLCIHYVENVVFPLETTRIYGGLYKKLFNKAKNVELKCYEDPDFYNKYTMAMDGADTKVTEIIKKLWGTIIGAIALMVIFKFMYDIDKLSVIFIISPIIGNFIFGNYQNKNEFKRYQEQIPYEKVLNYVNRTMYLPDGAKEIRLTNVFSLLKKQYNKATDQNVSIAEKFGFKVASLNFWRITFTFTVIFEGVLLYAIYKNRVAGTISLAEITVMTSLMVAMTWILIILFEDILVLMKNGVFVNNLRAFLEYEEKIPENADGIIPSSEFETLEFRNVSFSYKNEETIKNLSFTINKGDIVALVGHNGAGKTTIIKLLLRLYDPNSGEILLNGHNIKEYNLKAYRNMFATTFQDFCMFAMTVKENVLMGRTFDNEDEITIKALKRAGIYDKISTLPDGINTMMTKEFDEDGIVLSGGQHQKLAVARTFAKESPIKIFDEPSSALDPIAEYELFKNILKEGRTHTMVFISHRLSSVKNCDKVFMLEKGQIIEEGSHDELIKLNGKYAKMYLRQAMNYLAIENEKEVKL
ncbi:MAG: ABC transporter ATP-binding protein/permease [Clostridia bacterium]|nr:ABC transporter ATP-binding protein/permease [Clostridia bacterium]